MDSYTLRLDQYIFVTILLFFGVVGQL
ncbi:uncharacterized protein METZ01_LOCUS160968, partial [marine metagenome]